MQLLLVLWSPLNLNTNCDNDVLDNVYLFQLLVKIIFSRLFPARKEISSPPVLPFKYILATPLIALILVLKRHKSTAKEPVPILKVILVALTEPSGEM